MSKEKFYNMLGPGLNRFNNYKKKHSELNLELSKIFSPKPNINKNLKKNRKKNLFCTSIISIQSQ